MGKTDGPGGECAYDKAFAHCLTTTSTGYREATVQVRPCAYQQGDGPVQAAAAEQASCHGPSRNRTSRCRRRIPAPVCRPCIHPFPFEAGPHPLTPHSAVFKVEAEEKRLISLLHLDIHILISSRSSSIVTLPPYILMPSPSHTTHSIRRPPSLSIRKKHSTKCCKS